MGRVNRNNIAIPVNKIQFAIGNLVPMSNPAINCFNYIFAHWFRDDKIFKFGTKSLLL